MNPESFVMAIRGILANRMRSALTMLGILIGVSAVIILVAVGAGSATATRKSLEALGSNTLTVSAGGGGARGGTQARNIQINDADIAALSDPVQAPDVSAVVPIVSGGNSVTASFSGTSTPVGQFIGSIPSYTSVRNAPVQAGAFFTADDVTNHTPVVVIGVTTAKNLLGTTADPNSIVGQDVQFGSHSITVIGVLKPKGSNGFQDQDDIAILPESTVRDSYSGNTGNVNQVIVQPRTARSPTSPNPR